MLSLVLSMFLACGDKEEEVDTAVEAEETAEPTTEEVEDTGSEETEDTGTEEETEETAEFKTNDELGVCYLNGEIA